MEKFGELTEELKNYAMGWLQDVVPNHMAYDGQKKIHIFIYNFDKPIIWRYKC